MPLPLGVIGASGVAAAGGPDTYYYSTAADDADTGWESNAYGSPITCTSAGSLTKIGVYLVNYNTATEMKIALYNQARDTLLSSGGSAAPGTAQWIDITLASAISVTAGQVVFVCWLANGSMKMRKDTDGGTSFYKTSLVYADYPPASLASVSGFDGETFSARVYVD